jgi:hypothetical protein
MCLDGLEIMGAAVRQAEEAVENFGKFLPNALPTPEPEGDIPPSFTLKRADPGVGYIEVELEEHEVRTLLQARIDRAKAKLRDAGFRAEPLKAAVPADSAETQHLMSSNATGAQR